MPNTRIKLSYRTFSYLSWSIMLFCYFFQAPFRQLASLITVFLLLFIISEFGNLKVYNGNLFSKIFLTYVFFLSFSSLYSALIGTDIQSILRFLIILLLIPITTLIKDTNFSFEENSFIFFAVCKSLYLIYIAFQVVSTGNYMQLRSWAIRNGMGDIYPNSLFPFLFPKVQLQGNALIVVAFFLLNSIEYKNKIIKTFCNIILLSGIIVAGNFAFLLGVVLYITYKLIRYVLAGKNGLIKLFSLIVVIGVAVVFIVVTSYVLVIKSDYSNAIRIQQAKMLIDTNPVWGNGIGYRVTSDIGGFRDYSIASNYYELQTLYIYNQIGTVGMIWFMILTFMEIIPTGKQTLGLYILYLIYSFWNPYCFDSTHMITIILLQNLFQYKEPKNSISRIG